MTKPLKLLVFTIYIIIVELEITMEDKLVNRYV